MNRIERMAQEPSVRAALASFRERLDEAVQLAITIQQIPAPTFAEQARAAFVCARFQELGLADVEQDEMGNVYGRYPGLHSEQYGRASTPQVIVSAHLDTVFPAGTDLTLQSPTPDPQPHMISGPGIADNATGVAGLLLLAETLRRFDLRPAADLWFVANVGEEGLGDLYGMRAVVQRFGRADAYIVVEGGLFGQLFHQAISVSRYRIEVNTPGGHSWSSFGNPSAIHYLARLITAIDSLVVPGEPKTTYNVGVIEGGTSINTIAASAALQLDLRSEDPAALAHLVAEVERIVHDAPRPANVQVTMTRIGHRPGGRIPARANLVLWAETALRQVGCHTVQFATGSTDANVPLSLGYPAVCIGLATSGNAHRLDEYLDTTHLAAGLGQLLLLSLAAAA
ncbi:MAG: M20/M25/M40 family metallo-hydrolase [Chloroflexota bacterium]